MGKFVISDAKNGIKFNLVAGNGEIIATSQVYSTKATAKKGVASIIKNADVPVEDQTVKGFKALPNPKFEVYKDKKGEIRFRLKSSNGQIIATSEGYKDMAGAMNGVKSVKKNAADAKIVDETEAAKKTAAKEATKVATKPAAKTTAKKPAAKVAAKAPAKKAPAKKAK